YRLELPQELSRVHHTFHVSNLKKCYADEPLAMPLEGIHVDDKLQFVEEPVEIMEREIKRLKRSWIPLVKVYWNSRRGPEFTWERKDSFKQNYPQLFTNRDSSSTTRGIPTKIYTDLHFPTLVPRLPDTNIVRCMWLFRHKYLADGTLSRYKDRLVANGNTQLEGVDVNETFSPIVKPGTIWTVLSLATSRHWPIHQLDVKNAFLHGDLSETVYMHQPPGFRDSVHPDYVCLLHRSLYALKQASRALFQRFASYITRVGFSHSRCDSSLFIYRQGGDTAYLLLYVDVILLTASSERLAHMDNCNHSRTPIDTESKLGSDDDSVSDPTLYRSRSDISYAVQQVCLYMHDPREPHFSALKRVLRAKSLAVATQQLSSENSFALTVAKCSRSGIFITSSGNALEQLP
nr:ribonuclease H-like domain-containing protein [Tanacetum cinerariifolium]